MGPTFGVFLFDTSVRPVSFPRVARRNAPLEQGLDAATPVAVALFATHNRASCQQVRASLAFLAPRAARRAFAAVALAVAGAAHRVDPVASAQSGSVRSRFALWNAPRTSPARVADDPTHPRRARRLVQDGQAH